MILQNNDCLILYSLRTLIRAIIINWQHHKVVPPNLQALNISVSIKIVAMFWYKTTMIHLDAFSTYANKFCANNLLSSSSTRFAYICTKMWWCWAYIMTNLCLSATHKQTKLHAKKKKTSMKETCRCIDWKTINHESGKNINGVNLFKWWMGSPLILNGSWKFSLITSIVNFIGAK
jgi:hypothetical protein